MVQQLQTPAGGFLQNDLLHALNLAIAFEAHETDIGGRVTVDKSIAPEDAETLQPILPGLWDMGNYDSAPNLLVWIIRDRLIVISTHYDL
jgi:hypothetical protein